MPPELEALQKAHMQTLLADRLTSEERGLFSPLFPVKPPVRRRLPTGDEKAQEPVNAHIS